MLNEPQCLSREILKEYLAGWTDPNQLDMIEAHLAQCDDCEETVLALEADPDTLVAWVQSAGSLADESQDILTGSLSQARRIVGNSESKQAVEDSNHAFSARSNGELKVTRIGPYELLQSLGRGGMGDVYLARHRQLGKQVAIKLLPYHPFRNPVFAARFQREVRAAGCLEHRSIVRATDAGQEEGTHYLVMEHVDGYDLSRLVRLHGPLGFADTCEIGRQVAMGLSYAHALGIVHRDIKPSNLMLNTAGEVKILDFGLARVGPWSEESAELTTVGQLMGTLDYMAPEQAERADAVDYRADLYSLGATLFRLSTGRAPLAATTNLSPLAKIRLLSSASPPQLSTLREDAPLELVRLMSELLSRQPEDRPSCAATVAERLQELSSGNDLKLLLAQAQDRQATFGGREPQADSIRLHQAENDFHSLIGQDLSGEALKETVQPESADAMASGQSSHRSSGSRMMFALSAISLIGILGLIVAGGIILWLEDQKGTLTIESDSKVIVQVRKEGQPVKKLQLEPGATSTRLYAGNYEIILDQPSDAIQIEGAAIELLSKGTAVARIVQTSEKQFDTTSLLGANPINPPASNLSVANESTTGSSLEAYEPTYQGKSLSEWLKVVQLERDPERVNEAIRALPALLSQVTNGRIWEALLKAVKLGVWSDKPADAGPDANHPYRNAFMVLRKADPGAYVDTLVAGLSATDNDAYRIHIIRHGIPFDSKFEEMEPVYQWLQTEVFSKPSSYLTDAWLAIVTQLHYGPEGDRELILQILTQSPQLTDEFWLESLFHRGLVGKTYPGRKYKGGLNLFVDEVVIRCLKTLEHSEANAKSIILASASLAMALPLWNAEFSDQQQQSFANAITQQINRELKRTDILEEGAIVPALLANFVNPNGWGETSGGSLGGIPLGPHFNDVWVPNIQAMVAAIVAFEWKQEDLSAVIKLGDRLAVEWMVSNTPEYPVAIDPWNILDLGSEIESHRLKVSRADDRGRVRWPLRADESEYKRITACALLHQLLSKVPALLEPSAESFRERVKKAIANRVVLTFDSDSDGQLNSEEFSKLLEIDPELIPNFLGLEKIDANGDQLISVQEYIDSRNQLSLNLEQPGVRAIRKLIEKYDTNKDGQLSIIEVEKMPVRPLQQVDVNGDGYFQLQELLDWRNKQ